MPGRLFSETPIWARLFLAWADALTAVASEQMLRAAAACECMVAGYDLIDALDDTAKEPSPPSHTHLVCAAASLLLLAQEVLARLDLPADCRTRAIAVFARVGRRALAAHDQDVALRAAPTATLDAVLVVLRRRSGGLAALPCQSAALLADAPSRTVALAGRFGQSLGCAAQLEDDLADRSDDARTGRKTVPTVLAALHPDEPEVIEAVTWVLIHHYLLDAAQVITRLPDDLMHAEALWILLPPDLRPASSR